MDTKVTGAIRRIVENESSGFFEVYEGDFIVAQFEDRGRAEEYASVPDMLEALRGISRILEAFSYTTQLGKTQRDRLDKARSIIAASEVK